MPSDEDIRNLQCPTELRAAQEQLPGGCCPLRQMLVGLFEKSPQPMGIVSSDSRFLRANQALCEFTSYSEVQLRARTVTDLIHPEDIADFWTEVDRLKAGESTHFRLFSRCIAGTGHVNGLLLTTYPVVDEQGKLSCLMLHMVPVQTGSADRWRQLLDEKEKPAIAAKPGAWKTIVGVWLVENWQTVCVIVSVAVTGYLWLRNLQSDLSAIRDALEKSLLKP